MSSRQKDLAHVEAQILKLGEEAQKVQRSYQEYNAKVTARIREILEEAGVWDDVNALETERGEAQQRAQGKLKELTAKSNDLQRVRAFLHGREQEDPSEADGPTEEPVEPTEIEEIDPDPPAEGGVTPGDEDGRLKPPEF